MEPQTAAKLKMGKLIHLAKLILKQEKLLRVSKGKDKHQLQLVAALVAVSIKISNTTAVKYTVKEM
jgi:hypothetical protein